MKEASTRGQAQRQQQSYKYLTLTLLCLLVVSCAGGGGGGSGGGSGGGGNNGETNLPTQVDWSIFPDNQMLSIEWSNIDAFKQADAQLFSVGVIINDRRMTELLDNKNISVFDVDTSGVGIYNITGLTDGDRYKFDLNISLEYTNNRSGMAKINWGLPFNERDNNMTGIVVGSDHDRDGRADSVDDDDDNDGVNDEDSNGDLLDLCPRGEVDWSSNSTTDRDKDGCRDDTGEDEDPTTRGKLRLPDEAIWRIVPYVIPSGDGLGLIGGFNIKWDNIDDFTQAGAQQITVDLTGPVLTRPTWLRASIADFGSGNIFDMTNILEVTHVMDEGGPFPLRDDESYKFASNMSVNYDGVPELRTVNIRWPLAYNQQDSEPGGDGIRIGSDYDSDGWENGRDPDDDDDGVDDEDGNGNMLDLCPRGAKDWTSNPTTDTDADGCRDEDEDVDQRSDTDGDGLWDGHPWEQQMTSGGVSCSTLSDCDGDSVNDGDEAAAACVVNPDCDGDGIGDNSDLCPTGQTGWTSSGTNDNDGDGCRDRDEDIDDDGDGLIEISTAAELNAVRYQRDGTGQKLSAAADAPLNQLGCGGKMSITTCNGYELTADIDISSFGSGKGWLPIPNPGDSGSTAECQAGDTAFTSIFDGNGHIVSGLSINRPGEDCIGLFGSVRSATIRRLGVIAGTIIGQDDVGGLVGDISHSSIVRSYVVADRVNGRTKIGGLVGDGFNTKIIQSYVVAGMVHSTLPTLSRGAVPVGGLVGECSEDTTIVQSYAVTGSVRSEGSNAGGLVGLITGKVVQSYAVSGSVHVAKAGAGGLAVASRTTQVNHSYAVSGSITSGFTSSTLLAGFVSESSSRSDASSYWDSQTSGINARTTSESTGALPKNTMELRSPESYEGIYELWDDGSTIGDVDIAALSTTGTRWCDEDLSGMIEADEQRNDNRVWDFGNSTQYPAIRCTPDSLTEQRARWFLNAMGKPELN